MLSWVRVKDQDHPAIARGSGPRYHVLDASEHPCQRERSS